MESDERVDAVARSIAKSSGQFVDAAQWRGAIGEKYRATARDVLRTLAKFDAGIRSGGLPSCGRV